MNINNKISNQLMSFCDNHNLLIEAENGFRKWFKNEDKGIIDGWNYSDFIIKFHSHSFTFKNSSLDYSYITTMFRIYLSSDATYEIGNYKLITSSNGETIDDYLVFDYTKEEFENLTIK